MTTYFLYEKEYLTHVSRYNLTLANDSYVITEERRFSNKKKTETHIVLTERICQNMAASRVKQGIPIHAREIENYLTYYMLRQLQAVLLIQRFIKGHIHQNTMGWAHLNQLIGILLREIKYPTSSIKLERKPGLVFEDEYGVLNHISGELYKGSVIKPEKVATYAETIHGELDFILYDKYMKILEPITKGPNPTEAVKLKKGIIHAYNSLITATNYRSQKSASDALFDAYYETTRLLPRL